MSVKRSSMRSVRLSGLMLSALIVLTGVMTPVQAASPVESVAPPDARNSGSISTSTSVASSRQSAVAPRSLRTKLDLKKRSTSQSSSIWVVVNKRNPLAKPTYKPKGLVTPKVTIAGNNPKMRKIAARALEKMAKASKKSTGKTMTVISAYRSYSYLKSLYNRYVNNYGKKYADSISARAGYSEHQTGLAVDVGQQGAGCSLGQCFGSTATGKWVAKNSWKYGYIVRYPKGKTSTTGYSYEPWHLRFVGVQLATYMHENDISTLEQAFNKRKAPTYK